MSGEQAPDGVYRLTDSPIPPMKLVTVREAYMWGDGKWNGPMPERLRDELIEKVGTGRAQPIEYPRVNRVRPLRPVVDPVDRGWNPPDHQAYVETLTEPDEAGRQRFFVYWQGWRHGGREPGVQGHHFWSFLDQTIYAFADSGCNVAVWAIGTTPLDSGPVGVHARHPDAPTEEAHDA